MLNVRFTTKLIIPDKYKDFTKVFVTEKTDLLLDHYFMEYRINLQNDSIPLWGSIYVLSDKELSVLHDYLDKYQKKGWICRSISFAKVFIIFMPKKDKGYRFCINYRNLNKITKKDRTLLFFISEFLDRLCKGKIFTKLDLKDVYHRIHIKVGDEWKTVFRT